MQGTFDAIRARGNAIAAITPNRYNLFVDHPVLKWERNGGHKLREFTVRQAPRVGWAAEHNHFYVTSTGQIMSTFYEPEHIDVAHSNS